MQFDRIYAFEEIGKNKQKCLFVEIVGDYQPPTFHSDGYISFYSIEAREYTSESEHIKRADRPEWFNGFQGLDNVARALCETYKTEIADFISLDT